MTHRSAGINNDHARMILSNLAERHFRQRDDPLFPRHVDLPTADVSPDALTRFPSTRFACRQKFKSFSGT